MVDLRTIDRSFTDLGYFGYYNIFSLYPLGYCDGI